MQAALQMVEGELPGDGTLGGQWVAGLLDMGLLETQQSQECGPRHSPARPPACVPSPVFAPLHLNAPWTGSPPQGREDCLGPIRGVT